MTFKALGPVSMAVANRKRSQLTFLVLGEAAEGQHEDHSEDTGHLVLHGSFTGRPRVTNEPLPEFLALYRRPIC